MAVIEDGFVPIASQQGSRTAHVSFRGREQRADTIPIYQFNITPLDTLSIDCDCDSSAKGGT